MIVTVQDGVPVAYPGCHGLGVRVVHPVNPKAPAKNLGLVMFYVPPHVVLEPGSHETEETYCILEGRGRMTFANFQRDVKKGRFRLSPALVPARDREHGNRNARGPDRHVTAESVRSRTMEIAFRRRTARRIACRRAR